MFELDLFRGFAYKGKNGYIVRHNQDGLYVEENNKNIALNDKNTKIMEVIR